jgi:hypothetical protein
MRVETLLERIASLLLIYELLMFAMNKSWKHGVIYKIANHDEVKSAFKKMKKATE